MAETTGKRNAPNAENEVIVNETLTSSGAPRKRFYRSRAHCNPLSHNDGFSYPLSALHMDWSSHYPLMSELFCSMTINLNLIYHHLTASHLILYMQVIERCRFWISAVVLEG